MNPKVGVRWATAWKWKKGILPWLLAAIPVFKLSAVETLRMVFCAVVARIRAVLGPACGRLPFLGAIAGVDDDAVSGSMLVKDVRTPLEMEAGGDG